MNPVWKEIARRDAAMAAELTADWATGRSGDPTRQFKESTLWGFFLDDWLCAQFLQAAHYSHQLASGGARWGRTA
jgi:hypothetical protein